MLISYAEYNILRTVVSLRLFGYSFHQLCNFICLSLTGEAFFIKTKLLSKYCEKHSNTENCFPTPFIGCSSVTDANPRIRGKGVRCHSFITSVYGLRFIWVMPNSEWLRSFENNPFGEALDIRRTAKGETRFRIFNKNSDIATNTVFTLDKRQRIELVKLLIDQISYEDIED